MRDSDLLCCAKPFSSIHPAHLFFSSYLLPSFHDIFLLQQQISTAALISSHLAKMIMFAAIHVKLLARDFLSLTVHNSPNSPPSFFRRGMQVWRVETVAVVVSKERTDDYLRFISRDRSASRNYAEGGRDSGVGQVGASPRLDHAGGGGGTATDGEGRVGRTQSQYGDAALAGLHPLGEDLL
ncbi:hypothetical protein ZIOFF_013228 [Zingiber officinale]|uniref:Uncharacterized protein n=1 Tax=Zingiber officinale TaxID=94328 RepID=A0A8J5HZB9_ZINOF|nr:hypothetical protein ZIOFF_013228 [Zingiber officinale]